MNSDTNRLTSMNQATSDEKQSDKNLSRGKIDMIDILIILAKHKKKLIFVPLAIAVVCAAIALFLPNIYRANTKLLPPQQQSGAAALLSQLGGAAGLAAGVTGIKNPNDVFVSMLKSRLVADRIIEQFKLKKDYETDSSEKTRKILEHRTFITAGKDGLITIEVEDENQAKVADMTNAYVDALTKLTKELAVTEAAKRRLFFERQLEQAKDNLANAEITLKGAMDKSGVISVDADTRALVETVGRLRAQASAKEIQLSAMNAFVTANNPEYKRVQEELNSLRSELSRLENGRPSISSEKETSNSQGGLENIKVLRNVKYYQMLYELLAKQYELARLDEAKDPGIIQVLDRAVTPERKFRPKRAIMVILAALGGLFLSLIWIALLEIRSRVSSNDAASDRLSELKASLRFR